jgi:hypothetical protein
MKPIKTFLKILGFLSILLSWYMLMSHRTTPTMPKKVATVPGIKTNRIEIEPMPPSIFWVDIFTL